MRRLRGASELPQLTHRQRGRRCTLPGRLPAGHAGGCACGVRPRRRGAPSRVRAATTPAQCRCSIDSQDERSLCCALDRVFETRCGADALPSALAFATVGTQAESSGVRAFAARQLGRLLLRDFAAYGDATLRPLVALLSDECTPVAAAALSSLAAAAPLPGGLAALLAPDAGLPAMAAHADATVRLRVCELAARVAAASPAAAGAVAAADLFSGLLAELDRGKPPCQDILASLAALETLSALVESPSAAAGLGASALGVLPRVVELASAAEGAETLVRARALVVCARIVSALAAGADGTPVAALAAITEALTPSHAPPDVLSAAVEAVSVLGESLPGAELAAQSPPGLLHLVAPLAVAGGSGALSSQLSQSAAHALATVAGAERTQAEALLSPHAEVRFTPARTLRSLTRRFSVGTTCCRARRACGRNRSAYAGRAAVGGLAPARAHVRGGPRRGVSPVVWACTPPVGRQRSLCARRSARLAAGCPWRVWPPRLHLATRRGLCACCHVRGSHGAGRHRRRARSAAVGCRPSGSVRRGPQGRPRAPGGRAVKTCFQTALSPQGQPVLTTAISTEALRSWRPSAVPAAPACAPLFQESAWRRPLQLRGA